MSDTRELQRMLDQLVEPCNDERGDWQDVVRRAHDERVPRAVVPPRCSRHRRGIALALAALLALVALLASPAFGLRDALLGLIGRDDVAFRESPPAATVVKRQFADLGLGAPPRLSLDVVADETRRVVVAGTASRRVLDVAPTRGGGYCYLLERSGGGCVRRDGDRPAQPLGVTYTGRVTPGLLVEVERLSGTVNDARVTRLTVEFGDRHLVDIPFTWISDPIRAGFFAYDVPADRRTRARGPRAVTAWDAKGGRIARYSSIRYEAPKPIVGDPSRFRPRARRLPAKPPVAPTVPLRRATAHGVVLIAGANNSVLFDATRIEPQRRRLLEGRSASFACFRIAKQYGVTYARGYGVAGRFVERVGIRYFGLGALDACEIQGSYGHRWPDRFDSHSIVELPLTERGRRYFLDRAAARDLALFVRQSEMQELRRQAPSTVAAELTRRYGSGLVRLSGANADPPPGTIGYHVAGTTVTFVRLSETGRRFVVEVTDGRLRRNNLGELAMVF